MSVRRVSKEEKQARIEAQALQEEVASDDTLGPQVVQDTEADTIAIDAASSTTDSEIVRCEQCGTPNRIAQHAPGVHPVCGKCGSRLTEAIVEATFPIEDTPQKPPLKRIWIPQLVAVVMLLIALNPSNPSGYYTFLRFVCCAVFAYLAFRAFEQKIQFFAWPLVAIAVVYNPIVRVYLIRDIWTVINMVTIIIAIASAVFIKREISS